MSTETGKRPVLTLPALKAPAQSAALFCQSLKERKPFDAQRRIIPALNLIVHISPDVQPEEPLPAPWAYDVEPIYFLGSENQPVVWNGFVWSHYGDGTRHRVQQFFEGADIYGGRPLKIWNGVVYMHSPDGSVQVMTYRLGRCLSVSSRQP